MLDHTSSGPARSLAEIVFAVGLRPCTACGSREDPRISLSGTGDQRMVTCDCARCGTRSQHVFATTGNPAKGPHAQEHLGMDDPSTVITAQQFSDELVRLEPRVGDPTQLRGAAYRTSMDAAARAHTAAIELAKFPDAQLGRPRAEIETIRDRLGAAIDAHVAEQEHARARSAADIARLTASPSQLPPSILFRLAVEAGALAAWHDANDPLERLAAGTAIVANKELDHAILFRRKALGVERSMLDDKVQIGLDAAVGAGAKLPSPPMTAQGWDEWANGVVAAATTLVNELGRHGLEAAVAAFQLERARQNMERTGFLRADQVDHGELASVMEAAAKRGELARRRLYEALDHIDVPGVLLGRERLSTWADLETHESATERVPLHRLRHGYVVESNKRLRGILAGIADHLPL